VRQRLKSLSEDDYVALARVVVKLVMEDRSLCQVFLRVSKIIEKAVEEVCSKA
jgi:hypothetical protein